MKTFHVTTTLLALGWLLVLGGGGHLQETAEDCLRVGVFDSRALAVAYSASEQFERRLEEMRAEQERAREEGDEDRLRSLEAEGRALQARRHRQGFSTAPVDDVLEAVADEIPAIAEEAGVELIVSRWRLVHLERGAEVVDVTELLVAPFAPSERTRGHIRGLAEREPLPLYGTDWEAMERH